MAITLTKPIAGSSGWTVVINQNWTDIEEAVNGNNKAITDHTEDTNIVHSASQISVSEETAANLQEMIDAMLEEVANHEDLTSVGVKHKAVNITMADGVTLQRKIDDILAVLTVNTSSVSISARVQEIPGYISISASISPSTVSPRFWRAIVSKRQGTGSTATVVEVLTQDFYASRTSIPFDILSGVDVGDVLYIKVFAYFSDTSFVESNEQSLTYQGYESPIVERMRTLEEKLTITAIVESVKNDEDIITLLSNRLQNSTTLANKITSSSRS